MTQHFVLTSQPLDERAVAALLDRDGAGAVVTFVGHVRAHSRGRDVTKLEYEAYPEMVEGVFKQIADEIHARGGVIDVAIHHRVGTLEVGEVSVVVAVSAAHRSPAFDACRYAIDRLKQIAPIWKKEHSPDGAVWVEDRP
ncbi:MAG TPA: molybdenum cofactor biosynthesis protein MoaE [Candidatus Eremiobacteraceae bacterium]|jgi:molybdopterin synthase catalytic subunit